MYTSSIINETETGGDAVGVVLLDVRWNKNEPREPGVPMSMLGAAQWAWFEETLAAHAAAGVGLTLVMSSLTAVSGAQGVVRCEAFSQYV